MAMLAEGGEREREREREITLWIHFDE